MQKVNENTTLEIGKFYLVQCAKMVNEFGAFYFVPVIGKAHSDNQFGFPDKHIHIDGRFVNESDFSKLLMDEHGKTNVVCSYPPSRSYFVIESLGYRKMKCKRLTTNINPPRRGGISERNNMYFKWVDSMVGKSCKGKKCPHLGTIMHEENGILVCPLHNLKGCIEKEIITG